MQNGTDTKEIDQLLAEADELIRQISADEVQCNQIERRQAFGEHVEKLDKIKSVVRKEKKKGSDIGDSAEGIHAAILDIVKAMREMAHKWL
jgi:hypothetical protein